MLTEKLKNERLLGYNHLLDQRAAMRMSEEDIYHIVHGKMSQALGHEIHKRFPDYVEVLQREEFTRDMCVEHQSRVVVMTQSEYNELTGLVARLARRVLRDN